MCRVLAQNIELALKVLGVKRTASGSVALAIVRSQNHEGLEDRGFLARGSGAQDSAVGGNFSPSEDAESQFARDLGENSLLLLVAYGVVRLEEDVPDGVLSELRELGANLALSFALEEEVGDTSHDTRTIAIAAVGTRRTTMGHGA